MAHKEEKNQTSERKTGRESKRRCTFFKIRQCINVYNTAWEVHGGDEAQCSEAEHEKHRAREMMH